MEGLLAGLAALGDPWLLLLLLLATLGGVVIGALPGLNATTGAALLLPFTLTMEAVPAIAVMTAIYCAATFAGAITAILINTPGTSASATTCLDGYPLAMRGEAGRALGLAVIASTIGGVISIICLMIAAPMLARAAYHFSPPEYFALTLFGLSMLATIGDGSPTKNLISGALGVFLALVGVDNLTTVERFTFESHHLYEGIGFVPVMIGIFGISEMLVEGATVASMIGYNEAKRWSKNPEEFGHGAIEGIAGSEAANNSATGGAMVPTLALGIPGSATAAVILAGLMVHGLRPGPAMFTEQASFAYAIFWSMLFVNLLFLVIGLYGAKVFARITLVPTQLLWPSVFVFSVVGAYALEQSMFDVWIALAAGVLGYFMRRYGFSVVPLAIGLILGGMLEQRFGQSMVMLDEQWWMIASRPLAAFFLVLTVLALFGSTVWKRLTRK